jgi:hypothetical protein
MCRASLTRPTDHFQGNPTKSRPICGSDRVSEALHVPYQRDNRAGWIITADLCWSTPRLLIDRSVRPFGAQGRARIGSYASLSGSMREVVDAFDDASPFAAPEEPVAALEGDELSAPNSAS